VGGLTEALRACRQLYHTAQCAVSYSSAPIKIYPWIGLGAVAAFTASHVRAIGTFVLYSFTTIRSRRPRRLP
jgi:hypothetical protein